MHYVTSAACDIVSVNVEVEKLEAHRGKEIIMGCESAAKVVSDIFGEAHVVASALGCAVASAVGPMFGVPIEYQSCFNTAE
jgi:hypothetical protein